MRVIVEQHSRDGIVDFTVTPPHVLEVVLDSVCTQPMFVFMFNDVYAQLTSVERDALDVLGQGPEQDLSVTAMLKLDQLTVLIDEEDEILALVSLVNEYVGVDRPYVVVRKQK